MGLRVLSSGVDSLYFSCELRVAEAVLELVERNKVNAQESKGGVLLELGDYPTMVLPSGKMQYKYALSSRDMYILLSNAGKMPPVYVQLLSEFLHQVGCSEAFHEASDLVRKFLVFNDDASFKVSRIDLYSDFQGWMPTAKDADRFLCRANKRDDHWDGGSFTGFTWGRNEMVARLYDKSREILSSGKSWLKDVWGPYLDEDMPVWRLEFQMRRGMLKECGFRSVEDALDNLGGLWAYGLEWLSLREPSENAQRCRWPESWVWKELHDLPSFDNGQRVSRSHLRDLQAARLVAPLLGYLSSYGAVGGVKDMNEAWRLFRMAALAHLERKGESFEGMIRRKAALWR